MNERTIERTNKQTNKQTNKSTLIKIKRKLHPVAI